MTATLNVALSAVNAPSDVGMPRVIGLDLSLTATGVASSLGWAETIKPPAKMVGHDRMAHLRAAILEHTRRAYLVVIEGPSYGNQGQGRQSGHHERAGLWWLITHALWSHDCPVAIAPPACLKRYATGKGVAGKDDIMREVSRRFPWFTGGNDAADALILASMGADHLGVPNVVMPQTHRAALAGVAWPTVGIEDDR